MARSPAAPSPNLGLWIWWRLNNHSWPLRAREGAAGQAVVCRLLRGRSPPRGVAPKQQEGLRRAFSSGLSGGIPLSLGNVGARSEERRVGRVSGFGWAAAEGRTMARPRAAAYRI